MQHDHPSPEHDRGEHASDALETAQTIIESLSEEKVPQCSCHAAEKKSQTMSTMAAVFSLGALGLSIVSIALPFLRKSDDVTFDAQAWAEFLSTIEERVDDVPTTAPAASSKPAAMIPKKPASSTPVIVAAPVSSAPAAAVITSSAPTEEVVVADSTEPAAGTGAAMKP